VYTYVGICVCMHLCVQKHVSTRACTYNLCMYASIQKLFMYRMAQSKCPPGQTSFLVDQLNIFPPKLHK